MHAQRLAAVGAACPARPLSFAPENSAITPTDRKLASHSGPGLESADDLPASSSTIDHYHTAPGGPTPDSTPYPNTVGTAGFATADP